MLVRLVSRGEKVAGTAFGRDLESPRTVIASPEVMRDAVELLASLLGSGRQLELLGLQETQPVVGTRVGLGVVLEQGSNGALGETEPMGGDEHPSATRIARVVPHLDGHRVRAAATED